MEGKDMDPCHAINHTVENGSRVSWVIVYNVPQLVLS